MEKPITGTHQEFKPLERPIKVTHRESKTMENQYRQHARNPNHCNSNTVVPSVDDGFDVICTCTYFELETLVTSIYFYIRFLVVRFEAQGFSQSSIS